MKYRIGSLVLASVLGGTFSAGIPSAAAAAYPDALYRAIGSIDYVASCAHVEHKAPTDYARGRANISTTRLTSGKNVYVAYVHDECICGDGNCFIVAFVQNDAGAYRQVFSTTGFPGDFRPDGTLVMRSHSSAAVSGRDTFRFDGTQYRLMSSVRVYEATGLAKPADPIDVHFATGTSSATERGTVYQGFQDEYALVAAAGQTMSVTVTPIHGKLDASGVRIFDNTDPNVGFKDLKPGTSLSWHGKLASTGRYTVSIDGGEETASTYAMTISIH